MSISEYKLKKPIKTKKAFDGKIKTKASQWSVAQWLALSLLVPETRVKIPASLLYQIQVKNLVSQIIQA